MSVLFQQYEKPCKVCGKMFRAARTDALYCSGRCRMRMLRKCEGITRGAQIARAATGGAFAPPARPVTDTIDAGGGILIEVIAPPAKPKPSRPKPKPKKMTRAEVNAHVALLKKVGKRAIKPVARPKPKGKKGRAK